jgi:hypothetical protein
MIELLLVKEISEVLKLGCLLAGFRNPGFVLEVALTKELRRFGWLKMLDREWEIWSRIKSDALWEKQSRGVSESIIQQKE